MSNRPKRVAAQQTGRVRSGPSAPAGAKGSNATKLILVGVGVAVAVAIAVGIALSSGGDDESAGELEVGFAEIIGDPLPPFGGGADPAVGRPAPTIRAQSTFSAEVVDIDTDGGSVHVIGFFAHWCPHCQREVPRVTSWVADNGVPDGVEVVAVSTSVDQGSPNYPPSAWFNREGWPFEVLVDNEAGALAQGYGLSGFPYWVVVGPDGTVAERVSGELETPAFTALMERASSLVS